MRKTIAIILIACFVPFTVASAQDIFIKQHQSSNSSQQKQSTPIIDISPEEPTVKNKDTPPEEPAQLESETSNMPIEAKTPFDKDLAKKYYEDCILRPNEILTTETKQEFCACTSTKTMEEMSVEEIQTMFKDTAAGQNMRNVMLIRVYTPCMRYPARDLVYKSCVEDTAVSQNLSRPKDVCDCMADEMAEYTVEKAPDVIIKALRQNAQDLDPLALLFDDLHFNAHAQEVMTKCLYTKEYGWK